MDLFPAKARMAFGFSRDPIAGNSPTKRPDHGRAGTFARHHALDITAPHGRDYLSILEPRGFTSRFPPSVSPDAPWRSSDFFLTEDPLPIHLPGAVVQLKAAGVVGRSLRSLAMGVWRHSRDAATEVIMWGFACTFHGKGGQRR